MVFESFEKLYGRDQMVKLAYEVKDRIRDELGFAVNIGVSTNFLLSKMAGDFSKPDKVHSLFPYGIARKVWLLPVSDFFLWEGYSRKTAPAGHPDDRRVGAGG